MRHENLEIESRDKNNTRQYIRVKSAKFTALVFVRQLIPRKAAGGKIAIISTSDTVSNFSARVTITLHATGR